MFIQLLIEFFSAFLGFLFALLLAGVSDRHQAKKKYRLVLDCLVNELSDLSGPLANYAESKTVLNYPIATPVWDAMQSGGMVLELVDKPFFNDLIGTFAMIKAYNECRYHEQGSVLIKQLKDISASIATLQVQIEAERNK